MRINEHNLDSLRYLIRELQKENEVLKDLLSHHNIPFEEKRILDEQFTSDEYDEDQGARILPFNPSEDDAKEFYSYFWGRTDVYARRGKKGGYFPQCSGWYDNPAGIIDFALIGSAYHKGMFFPNIDSYGMVLVDECHHIASAQGQALMQRIRAKYVYGLSATPNRSDRLDDIIYMLLGPVRHKYTAKEQADAQGLERFVLPRFTRVVNITGETLDIHKADDLIATSTVRNEQIVTDTIQAVADHRTPVILTKLKRHAELLKQQLEGKPITKQNIML